MKSGSIILISIVRSHRKGLDGLTRALIGVSGYGIDDKDDIDGVRGA